jgi:hypothetical protein
MRRLGQEAFWFLKLCAIFLAWGGLITMIMATIFSVLLWMSGGLHGSGEDNPLLVLVPPQTSAERAENEFPMVVDDLLLQIRFPGLCWYRCLST